MNVVAFLKLSGNPILSGALFDIQVQFKKRIRIPISESQLKKWDELGRMNHLLHKPTNCQCCVFPVSQKSLCSSISFARHKLVQKGTRLVQVNML